MYKYKDLKRSVCPIAKAKIVVVLFGIILLNVSGCKYNFLQIGVRYGLPIPEAGSTIAFASCNNHNRTSNVFNSIIEKNPDLFIWVGDIIYPDRPIPWPGNLTEKIEHQYSRLLSQNDYQRLLAQVPISGIWDDHDYGINNGGAENQFKYASKELLIDFLGENGSKRTEHDGIYTSYEMEFAGLNYQLVLLDTRFFKVNGVTILGEEQWSWLNKMFQLNSKLVILVSGVSVVSDDPYNEGWDDFPSERDRLYSMIERSGKRVVIIAGDKHFAELNRVSLKNQILYEMVTSGVTHVEKPNKKYTNDNMFDDLNFGILKVVSSDQLDLKIFNEIGKPVLVQPVNLSLSGNEALTDKF